MLQSSTLKFLNNLKKNNNKPWFEAHRKQYETAKTDFYTLVENLIAAIAVFDPPIGQLAVKDCVFRINRDVRFSKDKRPYKNNMACYFNKLGKKGIGAGYYLHVEPTNSMAAGGIWMPEAPALAALRQEIDYNFADWKKVMEDKNFARTFTNSIYNNERLSRPPKGYDENNPAIQFLKMKSFVVSKPLTDQELQHKNLVKEVAKTFHTMKPMIDFINVPVS